MKLTLRLLGTPEVQIAEQVVTKPASAKALALLYYLAMTRQAHTRTHLAGLLWGDYPETAARANLRKVLAELADLLGDLVAIERHTVSLRATDENWIDALEFERLAEPIARRSFDRTALDQVLQALALYRGDFLDGFFVRRAPDFETWQLGERARLRQRMVQGLERVAHHFADQGDWPQAIAYARHLLALEPWCEEVHRCLITWLAQDRQRSAALAQYEVCRQVLAEELDVEPSQATQQLYARLQRQESEPPVVQHLITADYPLVGRQVEWQTLQTLWQQALQHGAQLVAIVGESGLGKTRLAEELLMYVQRQGHTAVSARTFPLAVRPPYGPVVAWLRTEAMRTRLAQLEPAWRRELAQLLPKLVDAPPDPSVSPLMDRWQQRQLFQALTYAFTADEWPLLLVLEDVQWCDEETLTWLPYLLTAAAQAKLLIVLTVQPEEVGPATPLDPFWRTLLRQGQLTTLELAPFSEAETAALAEQITSRPLSEQALAHLYQETAGYPFFVVERLRSALEVDPAPGMVGGIANGSSDDLTGNPTDGLPLWAGSSAGAGHLALPPKVLAALQARLGQLSPPAYGLAQLAACIGRPFPIALLVEASGQPEEAVVEALDELWQRRLLHEVEAGVFDFRHNYLREVAYSSINPVRRRWLHRRVAEALAALHAGQLTPIQGELVHHYERAGLPEQAAEAYQAAALTVLQPLLRRPDRVQLEIDLLHLLAAHSLLVKLQRDEYPLYKAG